MGETSVIEGLATYEALRDQEETLLDQSGIYFAQIKSTYEQLRGPIEIDQIEKSLGLQSPYMQTVVWVAEQNYDNLFEAAQDRWDDSNYQTFTRSEARMDASDDTLDVALKLLEKNASYVAPQGKLRFPSSTIVDRGVADDRGELENLLLKLFLGDKIRSVRFAHFTYGFPALFGREQIEAVGSKIFEQLWKVKPHGSYEWQIDNSGEFFVVTRSEARTQDSSSEVQVFSVEEAFAKGVLNPEVKIELGDFLMTAGVQVRTALVNPSKKVLLTPHSHPHDEFYLILEDGGNPGGLMQVDGEATWVKTGDVIRIPADKVHTISARGKSPLKLLFLYRAPYERTTFENEKKLNAATVAARDFSIWKASAEEAPAIFGSGDLELEKRKVGKNDEISIRTGKTRRPVFYVQSGEGTITVQGREVQVKKGQGIILPENRKVKIKAKGRGMRFLAATTARSEARGGVGLTDHRSYALNQRLDPLQLNAALEEWQTSEGWKQDRTVSVQHLSPESLKRYADFLHEGGFAAIPNLRTQVETWVAEKGNEQRFIEEAIERSTNKAVTFVELHGSGGEIPVISPDYEGHVVVLIHRPQEALRRMKDVESYPDEADVFANADAIVLLGEPSVEEFQRKFPDKEVVMIPHGFFETKEIDYTQLTDDAIVTAGSVKATDPEGMRDLDDSIRFSKALKGKVDREKRVLTYLGIEKKQDLSRFEGDQDIWLLDNKTLTEAEGTEFTDLASFREWLYESAQGRTIIRTEPLPKGHRIIKWEEQLINFNLQFYREVLNENRAKEEYSGTAHLLIGDSILVLLDAPSAHSINDNEDYEVVMTPIEGTTINYEVGAARVAELINDPRGKRRELLERNLAAAKKLTMREIAFAYHLLIQHLTRSEARADSNEQDILMAPEPIQPVARTLLSKLEALGLSVHANYILNHTDLDRKHRKEEIALVVYEPEAHYGKRITIYKKPDYSESKEDPKHVFGVLVSGNRNIPGSQDFEAASVDELSAIAEQAWDYWLKNIFRSEARMSLGTLHIQLEQILRPENLQATREAWLQQGSQGETFTAQHVIEENVTGPWTKAFQATLDMPATLVANKLAKGGNIDHFVRVVEAQQAAVHVVQFHGAEQERPIVHARPQGKIITVIHRPEEVLHRYPGEKLDQMLETSDAIVFLGPHEVGRYRDRYPDKVVVSIPRGFSDIEKFDKRRLKPNAIVTVGGVTKWGEMRRAGDMLNLIKAVRDEDPNLKNVLGYIGGSINPAWENIEEFKTRADVTTLDYATLEQAITRQGITNLTQFRKWLLNYAKGKTILRTDPTPPASQAAAWEKQLVDFSSQLFREASEKIRDIAKSEYSSSIHKQTGRVIPIAFESPSVEDMARDENLQMIQVPIEGTTMNQQEGAKRLLEVIKDLDKRERMLDDAVEAANKLTMNEIAFAYYMLMESLLRSPQPFLDLQAANEYTAAESDEPSMKALIRQMIEDGGYRVEDEEWLTSEAKKFSATPQPPYQTLLDEFSDDALYLAHYFNSSIDIRSEARSGVAVADAGTTQAVAFIDDEEDAPLTALKGLADDVREILNNRGIENIGYLRDEFVEMTSGLDSILDDLNPEIKNNIREALEKASVIDLTVKVTRTPEQINEILRTIFSRPFVEVARNYTGLVIRLRAHAYGVQIVAEYVNDENVLGIQLVVEEAGVGMEAIVSEFQRLAGTHDTVRVVMQDDYLNDLRGVLADAADTGRIFGTVQVAPKHIKALRDKDPEGLVQFLQAAQMIQQGLKTQTPAFVVSITDEEPKEFLETLERAIEVKKIITNPKFGPLLPTLLSDLKAGKLIKVVQVAQRSTYEETLNDYAAEAEHSVIAFLDDFLDVEDQITLVLREKDLGRNYSVLTYLLIEAFKLTEGTLLEADLLSNQTLIQLEAIRRHGRVFYGVIGLDSLIMKLVTERYVEIMA